ncbi:hypothetical protein SC660_09510, partial [Actinotignum timonense]
SGRRRRVRRKIAGVESETGAVETDAASPAAAPTPSSQSAQEPAAEAAAVEVAASPANGVAPVIRRGRERTVVRGSRGRRYQATGALS